MMSTHIGGRFVQDSQEVRAVDFDTEGIPAKIAGIAPDVTPTGMEPKEVRRLSRFILFALEAADQAWTQSGLDIEHEDPYRCGVALGTGIGGIEDIYENSVTMKERGARRVSPLFLPRGLTNMAAGQVAIRHGLQGVNKNIVTACAAGSQSIISGVESLRLGRADVMVVGGSESGVIPFGLAGFCSLRALSTKRNDTPTEASRPFDADRDGFVMGEGAGVLILESEAHAKARGAEILAEIVGVGESCDAYHVVAPRPDGSGPANAMRTALADAKIAPEKIDYCNAHGTSTKLNDTSESLAFKQVFGAQTPARQFDKVHDWALSGGSRRCRGRGLYPDALEQTVYTLTLTMKIPIQNAISTLSLAMHDSRRLNLHFQTR